MYDAIHEVGIPWTTCLSSLTIYALFRYQTCGKCVCETLFTSERLELSFLVCKKVIDDNDMDLRHVVYIKKLQNMLSH